MSSYTSVDALEKPYTCGHCGDSFTLLALLKNHMLVHTERRHITLNRVLKSIRLSIQEIGDINVTCVKNVSLIHQT